MAQDVDNYTPLFGLMDESALIHEWRAERFTKLGLSTIIAHAVAGLVDWHEFARLIERGCSPELALEIVR